MKTGAVLILIGLFLILFSGDILGLFLGIMGGIIGLAAGLAAGILGAFVGIIGGIFGLGVGILGIFVPLLILIGVIFLITTFLKAVF